MSTVQLENILFKEEKYKHYDVNVELTDDIDFILKKIDEI